MALDTAYAPAWARLSQATSLQSISAYPRRRRPSVLEWQVSVRLRLRPTDRKVIIALGDYYRRVRRDYARALDEYAQGGRQSYSNAEGFAERPGGAGLGRWDAAVQHLQQAATR